MRDKLPVVEPVSPNSVAVLGPNPSNSYSNRVEDETPPLKLYDKGEIVHEEERASGYRPVTTPKKPYGHGRGQVCQDHHRASRAEASLTGSEARRSAPHARLRPPERRESSASQRRKELETLII